MKIAHGGVYSVGNEGKDAVEFEGDEEVSRQQGQWVPTDERGDGDWDGCMVEGISFTDDNGQEYRIIR